MDVSISYAIYTDAGSREVNEDRTFAGSLERCGCFVVCDGLGGHGMGDTAAQIAADTFRELFESGKRPEALLPEAFAEAQRRILKAQSEMHAEMKMKTTCAALVLDPESARIGHAGDSRVYVFRKNKVASRTLDHSVPQMLALAGDIPEEQIRFHPKRNLLLRVMGDSRNELREELENPVPLRKCQAFLLCSDGFWELISEEDMCRLLKASKSAKEWLVRMAQEVKRNGEGKDMDNQTAIAVRLD